MLVNFIKMNGIGNDFIMLDLFKEPELDYQRYAKDWCHRQFGIGADGLVLIQSPENKENDLKMTIYNADGSESEMCGNAIRCYAKYAYVHKLVTDEEFRIETKAGVIIPKVIVIDGVVKDVRVDMGLPHFTPKEIPIEMTGSEVINKEARFGDACYRINAISMGNPHCVIFIKEDVDRFPLEKIGPMIETDPLFPARVNVEFVKVIERGEVKMRVWERGVGETLACGTGACATVVACIKNDLTDSKVLVHLPGGDLVIEWVEGSSVFMTGPASYVFTGQIELSNNQ